VAATVSIGGSDVTGVVVSGHSTRRLNRPSQAQVRIPSQNAIGNVGDRLKISFNGGLHHHGRILLIETEMGEDTGYTTYNSTDPMEMWAYRPVRAEDGDFSKPDINELGGATLTGSEMIGAALYNTQFAGAGPDTDAEGDIFLDFGTFETGGADLTGAPVDWPMSIAEFVSLLVSTGTVDVVIVPTDPGGGVMGTVSCYNGDYGTDLSGSVSFDYGQGNYNIRALRWNQDMANMCNKLWYYAGPRIATPADPAGDQHWCFNVTGTDPDMLALDPMANGVSTATLISERNTSRSTYGVRMEIQIFDATDEECVPGWGTFGRDLYRRRWQTESWIRQQPRNLIHITPTRETAIGSFDIGDIVGVSASSAVRGGFSGAQRVYEYTISWDENGVLALSELQTSDTADS
jgi:hypothetical protein